MNMQEMQALITTQQRIITNQANELQWIKGIIHNPSYTELDIRFIEANTPLEIKYGIASDAEEFPERKVYMPAQAEKLHASDKTAGKVARKLADAGLFSYRTSKDPDTGNTRVHMAPTPQLAAAPIIEIERAKRGGSTWEDGKRTRYCSSCGSTHLVGRKQTKCEDCGAVTADEWKPVNAIDTPNSQDDCWSPPVSASDEFSKVPSITVDTLGVYTEIVEPPEFLRNQKIWCCHRAKVPYQPWGRKPQKAKSNDAATWGTYDQARRLYEDSVKYGYKEAFDGIGFMCTGEFTVVDYDHCIEAGQVSEKVTAQMCRIDSYAEVSYSGTGIHQIAIGKVPREIGVKRSVEMYDHARFMTWTGKHIIGTPATIEQRQAQLTALFEEIAPEKHEFHAFENLQNVELDAPAQAHDSYIITISDDEVLQKASNAANGAKFTALFNGDWSGYPSQSEADLALCIMLAYWSDANVHTIDSLFRKSGLMRDKWDEKHGTRTEGDKQIPVTYGDMTISRALQLVKDRAA